MTTETRPAPAGATQDAPEQRAIAGVGYSEQPRSREAGAEAARQALAALGGRDADLVLMYCTDKHDPVAFHEGVRSVVGSRPRIAGGYAGGVITNTQLGQEGLQVGVAALSLPAAQVDLFMAGGLPDNERAVGEALGRQIAGASLGADPNLLLMYDIIKEQPVVGLRLNMATPLLAGLQETLGQWPRMAGLGMMGGMQWNSTYQWFDDRVEQQSAIAVVLSGGVRLDAIVMHGCRPSSDYHTITKAEGNVVLEFDGRPAMEVVAELLGPEAEVKWEDQIAWLTLGVNNGDKFGPVRQEDYAVRLCQGVDAARGGFIMFGDDLQAGCEVQLMRRAVDFDYMRERMDLLLERVRDRRPFFALYIDCIGRMSTYCGTAGEEAEVVQEVLGDRMPLLGVYTGCELAPAGSRMQSHNWTGVLCIFSE